MGGGRGGGWGGRGGGGGGGLIASCRHMSSRADPAFSVWGFGF